MRSMTRNDVLPSEDVVAGIENQFPRSKAAALARMLRARIKLKAGDAAGAAALLNSQTDWRTNFACRLRACGCAPVRSSRPEKLTEARAIYQEIMQSHPASLRARDAALRVADLMTKSGESSAVPLLLKDLAQANDAAALLATAKAYEQSSDQNRALAAYRRLYFFAPESAESADAATAITRLGSTTAPAQLKKQSRALIVCTRRRNLPTRLTAYSDAFAKFPATATNENQLRRGIAAYSATKDSRSRRSFECNSEFAPKRVRKRCSISRKRTREQNSGNRHERLRKKCARHFQTVTSRRAHSSRWPKSRRIQTTTTDATYFRRAAVNGFGSSIEVAQAQFDLAWDAHEAKNYLRIVANAHGASRLLRRQEH